MTKKPNYWLDAFQDYWCCTRHQKNSERPSIDVLCWKRFEDGSFCHSARPTVGKVLYEAEIHVLCAYVRCKGDKGKRGVATGKSKYCSPACRKKKARDKYNSSKRAAI